MQSELNIGVHDRTGGEVAVLEFLCGVAVEPLESHARLSATRVAYGSFTATTMAGKVDRLQPHFN